MTTTADAVHVSGIDLERAMRFSQVVRFYANYSRAATSDLERWPDFFAPDVDYWVNSAENVRAGRTRLPALGCKSRNAALIRAEAIMKWQYLQPCTEQHQITDFCIDCPAPGQLAVTANFSAYRTPEGQPTRLIMNGTFDDLIEVATDGTLRFRQHHVTYNNYMIITSIVYPF